MGKERDEIVKNLTKKKRKKMQKYLRSVAASDLQIAGGNKYKINKLKDEALVSAYNFARIMKMKKRGSKTSQDQTLTSGKRGGDNIPEGSSQGSPHNIGRAFDVSIQDYRRGGQSDFKFRESMDAALSGNNYENKKRYKKIRDTLIDNYDAALKSDSGLLLEMHHGHLDTQNPDKELKFREDSFGFESMLSDPTKKSRAKKLLKEVKAGVMKRRKSDTLGRQKVATEMKREDLNILAKKSRHQDPFEEARVKSNAARQGEEVSSAQLKQLKDKRKDKILNEYYDNILNKEYNK